MQSSYFLCELYRRRDFNRRLTHHLMQVVRGYNSRKLLSAGLGNYLFSKEPGADLPLLSHLESEQTYYNTPYRIAVFQHRLVLLLWP
jgi:hypothetical protein